MEPHTSRRQSRQRVSSPLITQNCAIAVAPQYFGTVGYYAMTASFATVYIDGRMMADKRFKSAHRCRIVDTRDEIMLTVPVSHPHGRHSWDQVMVSTHGHWWTIHLNALESAYGRTPFFEFYIDKFAAIFNGTRYSNNNMSVSQLDYECDDIIRKILGLDNRIVYIDSTSGTIEPEILDMRQCTGAEFISPQYYQLRADRLGFKQGMSILDLIFNMGPEAALVLKGVKR